METKKMEHSLDLEIKRIESILAERQKAIVLQAETSIIKDNQAQVERFLLRDTFYKQMSYIKEQISGSLGLELRMRAAEQARGVLDAKLYLVIIEWCQANLIKPHSVPYQPFSVL